MIYTVLLCGPLLTMKSDERETNVTTITGTSGDDTISGGNGADTIYGGDGNDIISGGNGVDALFGEGGNDQLSGDNGADDLTGGAGDDLIDGSNGFDTAYYSGPIDEYSFFSAAGYLHILHLGGAGADGHDRVINVERLVFADRVIDIGSGKNAPVAGDDHVFINEDTGTYSSGAASVKDNDFDFDGDALTVTGGTFTGTYGTLTLNANGTYSYTLFASVQALDEGENVTDSFNYTVSDNDGSDTGTLVFHIAGLNDAPVANDDTASTTEDAAVSGNVLANDTDVDVEPLVVANPGTYVGAYGTLVLAANGSYTYTPNAAAQALDDGEVGERRLRLHRVATAPPPTRRRSPSPSTAPTTPRSPMTTPLRRTRTPPASPATCSPTTPTSTSSR